MRGARELRGFRRVHGVSEYILRYEQTGLFLWEKNYCALVLNCCYKPNKSRCNAFSSFQL